MIILNKLITFTKFLLFTNNGFIAICAAFFFATGYLLINDILPSLKLISLIFFCTMLIYQVNTKINLDVEGRPSLKFGWNGRLIFLMILSIVIFFYLTVLSASEIILLVHLGVLSLLYNLPGKTALFKIIPLRSIPVLKIFLISYVWAAMSSFFPALLHGKSIGTQDVLLVFVGNFSFIIAITLPFDIRDNESDKDRNIITFPGIMGIAMTKVIGICCLLLFLFIYYSQLKPGYLLILFILVLFLLLTSSSSRRWYFYLFYIDGTIILYFFVVVLSSL